MTNQAATKTADFSVRGYLMNDGLVHVHRADCADCTKARRRSDSAGRIEHHASIEAMAADWYADIAEENDEDPASYTDQFKVYPCVPAAFGS